MRICPDEDLPVVCSVCLVSPANHEPKLRYVDFQAAYDGPVVQNPNPGSDLGVYVENIVVCEECFFEAARLLGLGQVEDAERGTETWKAYAEDLEKRETALSRMVSNLQHTVGSLLDNPIKRPPGRPHFAGPDSHKAEIKEMRSRQQKRERVKKKAAKP